MTLTLDAQTEQRIQREIDLGHATDPAEVINRALDLLKAEDRNSSLSEKNSTASSTNGWPRSIAAKVSPKKESGKSWLAFAWLTLDERLSARAGLHP